MNDIEPIWKQITESDYNLFAIFLLNKTSEPWWPTPWQAQTPHQRCHEPQTVHLAAMLQGFFRLERLDERHGCRRVAGIPSRYEEYEAHTVS